MGRFEYVGGSIVPLRAGGKRNKTRKTYSVSVIGLGYVGAVSCGCLASLGHRLIGVDTNSFKTSAIALGKSPIHEAGLDALLTEAVEADLLSTTHSVEAAVRDSDVTLVSVGTPTAPDGGCDYRYIKEVAEQIGNALATKSAFHVVVLRCSVPPGTTLEIMAPILEAVSGKTAGEDFGLAFNPEFLREGVAIDDFRHPPKTVIGASDDRTWNIVADIFRPVDPNPIRSTINEAELVKYIDNVWHATKVCFANEVGRFAKSFGLDGVSIMSIFAKDKKLNISDYYLRPGFAYGGSCLPKEVRAVNHLAKARNLDLPLLNTIGVSNRRHIEEVTSMACQSGARRIAVLGVAFKPGTDDLRESPILEVMASLLRTGIDITAHDFWVGPGTDIAGQMSYVSHGAAGLVRLANQLPALLSNDLDAVLETAELAIVTHRDPRYAEALNGRPDIGVIDVVRLFDEVPDTRAYAGIGW